MLDQLLPELADLIGYWLLLKDIKNLRFVCKICSVLFERSLYSPSIYGDKVVHLHHERTTDLCYYAYKGDLKFFVE